MEDADARKLIERAEHLLDAIDEDEAALEAVGAVVQLYGEALRRIVERVAAGGSPEEDELVEHLLLLHDLHPVDVETRVRHALDEVRPYLGSHGGDVELLAVEDGVVRLRLGGSCDGCPSSTATLKLAIEEAIGRAAPEIEQVEAEGVAEPRPALLQLGSVRPANGNGSWTTVGTLHELPAGGTVARRVDGSTLRFARLDGAVYAYRDRCAGCAEPLGDGELDGGELRCAACGRRFDARRAGRCLDEPQLYLEPVPLLDRDGLVRVAVPAEVR